LSNEQQVIRSQSHRGLEKAIPLSATDVAGYLMHEGIESLSSLDFSWLFHTTHVRTQRRQQFWRGAVSHSPPPFLSILLSNKHALQGFK
jgi:hypothetical protein